MKKILFILALLPATCSFAQNCNNIVAKDASGKETVQVNKALATSDIVPLTFWLSKDNNNVYLNIHPHNTSATTPMNFKGTGKETFQLVFIDGRTMDSKIAVKTGADVKVTLNKEMTDAFAYIPLQGVNWYENGSMTPGLTSLLSNTESDKLLQATACLK